MSLQFERQGMGRTLLMVHGLGANLRTWDSLLTALRGSRELILVDLPGHGRSAQLAGPQTVEAHADALASFVKSQCLTTADLVGTSVGGPAGAGVGAAGHRSALRGARSRWFLVWVGNTLVSLDARGVDTPGAVAPAIPSWPVAPRRHPHAAASPTVGPSVGAATVACRRGAAEPSGHTGVRCDAV
ncbi:MULTISPECIES: alpha/beta fold hydrolase [Methylobacterium]|uniref:alpha/beta fold hydrolase n=1 Tax=Methylobacterium TaxID=407 RepID=UPI00115FBFCD